MRAFAGFSLVFLLLLPVGDHQLVAAQSTGSYGYVAGLHLDEARSVLQTALDFIVREFGNTVQQCAVVLDTDGNLKAGMCVDGAPPISQEFAMQKARTALAFGASYEQSKPLFGPGNVLYKLDELFAGVYTPIDGAVPLVSANGVCYGAVGVSGAPSGAQDFAVANASLAGLGKNLSAATMHVSPSVPMPLLSDAFARLAACEAAAALGSTPGSLAIYNDAAFYVLFYRIDGSLFITQQLAMEKARSAALTRLNTSTLLGLAQPNMNTYLFDNSNKYLSVTPGGFPFSNSQGQIIGALGCSSGLNTSFDETVCMSGLTTVPRPAISPIMASSVNLQTAYAVVNAGLAKAQTLGVSACIAVVGMDAVVKVLACGTGVPPAGADHSIKKARTVVYLGFPGTILNEIVRPGPYYGLADAESGLVVYSGLQPLYSGAVHVGGVGVFSEGDISADNAIVDAAAAACSAGATATSLVLPSFSPFANIDPTGAPYFGAALSSNNLLSLCNTALQMSASAAVCSARDGTGSLRLLIAEDGIPSAAVDLSVQTSKASFVFPHASGAFQQGFSPFTNTTTGAGLYFTGQYVGDQRFVAVPGGQPLFDPIHHSLIGSLAVSTGLASPSADNAIVAAAAATLPAVYSGDPLCSTYSSLQVVDAYLSAIFSGNINTAASYTAGSNFTFSWHGPQDLIPIAGIFTGSNALQSFFGNVNRLVRDFTLNQAFAPTSGGVRTVAADCTTVVKQWQEVSVVIATGKPISQATNTVIYTVRGGKIQSADVWVDTMMYAQAFCGGSVACGAGAGAATAGSSCDTSDVLKSVRGFGATNLILLIITVGLLVRTLLVRTAAPSHGVPYVSM